MAPALPAVEVLSGDHPATRFAPHWHEEWGLAAIERGACHFTCGGDRCVARAGDLVLIPARVVHTAGVDPAGLRMTMVYLPEALVSELLDLPTGAVPQVEGHVLRAPALAHRLAAASSSREAAALRAVAAEGLRRFHRRAGSRAGPTTRPEGRDPRVAALCAALRVPGRPDLAGLAARLGISRGYFQRLFRRVVGLTPAEYGRLSRLAEAKDRLAAGAPPAAAAAAAGFADQAHLTRWMRAVYGVTPARIRPRQARGRP